MMLNKMLSVAATGLAALVGAASPVPAPAPVPAAPHVREIADVTLRDVAVALYHPERPVIYYNPRLMGQLGPELTAFFMAHEHAHIALRHTRAGALRSDPSQRDRMLRTKELEADCLAARSLGTARRSASLAAARFFARLGNTSFDSEHPYGSTRAARILACMPE